MGHIDAVSNFRLSIQLLFISLTITLEILRGVPRVPRWSWWICPKGGHHETSRLLASLLIWELALDDPTCHHLGPIILDEQSVGADPKACLPVVARNRHYKLPPAVRGKLWQCYSFGAGTYIAIRAWIAVSEKSGQSARAASAATLNMVRAVYGFPLVSGHGAEVCASPRWVLPNIGKAKLGMAWTPRHLTMDLNLYLPDRVTSEGCLNGAVPGT